MGWVTDTYRILKGDGDINATAICTGKPLELEGIDGRNEATGLGLYYATKKLLNTKYYYELLGMEAGIKGKTCIV